MPAAIRVKCSCGRILRTSSDNAGMDIRCWDCRSAVHVPQPYTRGQLVLALRDQVQETWTSSNLMVIGLAALMLTLALCVPRIGILTAGLALLVCSQLYCLTIRRAGLRGSGQAGKLDLRTRLTWLGVGGLGVVALAAPPMLRFAGVGSGETGRVIGPMGVVALVLAWSIVPLIMAALASSHGPGPLGLARMAGSVTRHPMATLVALLVLPVGLIAVEAATAFMSYQYGWIDGYLRDLSPVTWSYWEGLKHGYLLIGALPRSLLRGPYPPTKFAPDVSFTHLAREYYYAIQAVYTYFILLGVMGVLSLQARLLGVMATWSVRHADDQMYQPMLEAPGWDSQSAEPHPGTALTSLPSPGNGRGDASSDGHPMPLQGLIRSLGGELELDRDRWMTQLQDDPCQLLAIVQEIQDRARSMTDRISASLLSELMAQGTHDSPAGTPEEPWDSSTGPLDSPGKARGIALADGRQAVDASA
ncbi:hypothetical protein EP7_000332 [Isosphaeraceae bacterium EP7]